MVKTVYSESNLTYSGDIILNYFKHFIMVLCQENGDAPQIWSIIISVVFSALWFQGSGIHFANYFTKEVAQLVGFICAYDCDMVQLYDDVEAIHRKMKLAIYEWEDLIRITGGCLAPGKSVWYLVNYEWKQAKWKCKNPGQENFLEDTNKAGEFDPLQYLHANEAMSMMGMYLALDYNNDDQVEYMQKKATDWATSIRPGVLQHNKAWRAFNYTKPQILLYPLPAMMINEK